MPKHIEFEFGIVNIYTGLSDRKGRRVSVVEIIADGDRFAGERPKWISGKRGSSYKRIRIIEMKTRRIR